jgi:hypothetical protein
MAWMVYSPSAVGVQAAWNFARVPSVGGSLMVVNTAPFTHTSTRLIPPGEVAWPSIWISCRDEKCKPSTGTSIQTDIPLAVEPPQAPTSKDTIARI